MSNPIKLNLGSGRKKIDGFTNVDGLEWDGNTDIVMDLTEKYWDMLDNSVDEIVSEEFLEHISFRDTHNFLKNCYRILKDGGLIRLQVPDIGKMIEYYPDKICDCVPRKANSYEEYKADPNCIRCQGRAKIHPERWLFAFTGAQKHKYDAHLNIFTKERMQAHLEKVGFDGIIFEDNIYKIKVSARKI